MNAFASGWLDRKNQIAKMAQYLFFINIFQMEMQWNMRSGIVFFFEGVGVIFLKGSGPEQLIV